MLVWFQDILRLDFLLVFLPNGTYLILLEDTQATQARPELSTNLKRIGPDDPAKPFEIGQERASSSGRFNDAGNDDLIRQLE